MLYLELFYRLRKLQFQKIIRASPNDLKAKKKG